MAQHKSAIKRIRTTERRTTVNRSRVTKIRSQVKKVETAIAVGDKKAAQDAFKLMQPELMSGVNKGIVTKNAVSRKLSRLTARIKALPA